VKPHARTRGRIRVANRSKPRFTYRQQYGVIVVCRDEAEQRRVYERLSRAGHSCRGSQPLQRLRSYRAARVKSLFNAESGCNFDLVAELPIDDAGWRIGVIVGPSGSGKTSSPRDLAGRPIYEPRGRRKPIIDAIAPEGDFDDVTAALSAVGLGSVPAWLRPFRVLSNGEQFRANLAR
jgi:hypothetical protein